MLSSGTTGGYREAQLIGRPLEQQIRDRSLAMHNEQCLKPAYVQ